MTTKVTNHYLLLSFASDPPIAKVIDGDGAHRAMRRRESDYRIYLIVDGELVPYWTGGMRFVDMDESVFWGNTGRRPS